MSKHPGFHLGDDPQFTVARREHIHHLRSEGVTFGEIAKRLGISCSRANELFKLHQSRIDFAAWKAAGGEGYFDD